MTLYNQHYFAKQTLEISKSTLKIQQKNLFEEVEYEISFEQIDNKKRIEVKSNSSLFFIGIFFLAIGIIFIFGSTPEVSGTSLLISTVLILTSFINKKRTLTITTYQEINIVLFFTKKNKRDIIDFADKVISASNQFLLNKYGKIDKDLPIVPQLDNLQFLKNREIITEKDFENLKKQLLGKDNKTPIGFGNNN